MVEAEGIADLVDPNREVGVPPEDYAPVDPPIPPGDYLVLAAPGVTWEGVTKDQANPAHNGIFPQAKKKLIIQEGDHAGKSFTIFVTTKPSPSRQKGTSADDLLHACNYGRDNPYPRTAGEYRQAIRECSGIFTYRTELEATCPQRCKVLDDKGKEREISIRGRELMQKLSFNEDGSRNYESLECPECGAVMEVRTSSFGKFIFRK